MNKTVKREQTTIRLPADLKERLQQEAHRRGDSFNGFVVRSLFRAVEATSNKRP